MGERVAVLGRGLRRGAEGRCGFRVLLDSDPDRTVVAAASNATEAISLALEHRPEVVLMDIRMPEVDGLEAASAILGDERHPRGVGQPPHHTPTG